MPTPIMGSPSAPHEVIVANARLQGCADWFLKALDAIWIQSSRVGVDPVVAAAQCAHETGWGRFGGAVTAAFGNVAGLKVRDAKGDKPEDHARFAIDVYGRPLVGALAQAHHLALYAGVHVPLDTPDERAVWIWPGTTGFGSARTVEALGGKWAPHPDYGNRVAAIVAKLRTSTSRRGVNT